MLKFLFCVDFSKFPFVIQSVWKKVIFYFNFVLAYTIRLQRRLDHLNANTQESDLVKLSQKYKYLNKLLSQRKNERPVGERF